MIRIAVAGSLAVVALVAAIVLGVRARNWNDELAIESPFARTAPIAIDPHTPRLARRVVLVVIDGLGADEADLPFLDELRARGVAAIARVPYPTISRPNYVTILTGVPPADSGVRANRVREPVGVDTVLDRAQAAGLRVATASDFGMLPSLFLRHTSSLAGIAWLDDGVHIAPPPPITWPVDEAERASSLAELGPMLAELASGDASLITALVLDVDRAGHADGVGARYRAAAADTDRMLRVAFAAIDFTRDAVIVTADHGHVAPGGHGGVEPEVSHVPLILVGAGIVPGARAFDARLIDVAATVATLLGIPAPGHAEGRGLVELLALSPADASRRAAVDAVRAQILASLRTPSSRPDVVKLAGVALAVVLVVALALALHRRGAIVIPRWAPVGAIAMPVMLGALVVMTRGHLSPSYVPSLPRVEEIGGVAALLAIVLQVGASRRAIRHAPDRLAAASGVALVGLGVALVAVAIVRAWYAPPFVDVPPPLWFAGVPALELGAASCGLATVIALALAGGHSRFRGGDPR